MFALPVGGGINLQFLTILKGVSKSDSVCLFAEVPWILLSSITKLSAVIRAPLLNS